MYGKVLSACVHGIDGKIIEVEVDISNGLPQITIVGLPDSAIRESIERVRAAIKNCGFIFPMERITVNLAPADVRKEGSSFDLAIALGILLTSEQVKINLFAETLIIGELALDGTLKAIPGVLSMVDSARNKGFTKIILPIENAAEARLIGGVEVIAIHNLREIRMLGPEHLINAINNLDYLPSALNSLPTHDPSHLGLLDYADVNGQHHAKRALMISAAGMHNLLFIGPPGTGKTMLVRRLPTILPTMLDQEALEVTKIYSVSGQLNDRAHFIRNRPFRSPHHTISAGGLIGGGAIPKPGEVSLAHRGVLFLDELPEFSRSVLEVLRQPLEDRSVTISRTRAVFTFPSHFILAASMNPCPCGYYGAETATNVCTCSPLKLMNYRSRISGPLLDRIDLHVEVPRMNYAAIKAGQNQLSSAQMKQSVLTAQGIQQQRYVNTGLSFNGELTGRMLRSFCQLNAETEQLLMHTFDALGLSVRAHDRILKIARTIADLDDSNEIQIPHVAEAIQYRNLDRKKQ